MAKAWLAGYSGKDVLICIVDDGLDHPHPELRDHYVSFYKKRTLRLALRRNISIN